MLAILLRFWVVGTIAWLAYNFYLYRDKLDTFKQRDWLEALGYGINNVLCDLKVPNLCRQVSVSFFRRSEVNETFGFIVTFVGWPVLGLFSCLVIGWILRAPRRAHTSGRR
jgi:hypothetical protein